MGKVTIIIESDDTSTTNLTAGIIDELPLESVFKAAVNNYADCKDLHVYLVPNEG
ncbi:MAG: hypothetical protein M0R06_00275 [Sphaerochaeta sp.]|jgi:hypothetical protein|nr:hypothetical protein [Sphaerochaeta sp.]